nr:hypothetical protein [Tanacetum cinerariifolium]
MLFFLRPPLPWESDGIFCRRLGNTSVGICGVFPPSVQLQGPSQIVTSNGIFPNGHDSSPEKPIRGVLESTRRDLIDAFNFRKQCSYITLHEFPLSKYALFTYPSDMYTLITTGSDEPSFRMGET